MLLILNELTGSHLLKNRTIITTIKSNSIKQHVINPEL